MIHLDTTCHHTKILQSNWLYSPNCTYHPYDSLSLITESLYLLMSFTYFIPQLLSPLVTTCFFSVSTILFCFLIFFLLFCILDSTYKWNPTVFAFLWLISLSIIPSWSIHFVTNDKILYYWVIFHCVHIYVYIHACKPHLLTHSSIDGHLDCVHILTSMNIGVHVSFSTIIFVFFGKIHRNEVAELYGSSRASQMVLMVKNLPANARDLKDAGSILISGRSPGGGHGNPLQYSCLENPMDRGAWQDTVHRVAKSRTWLKCLSMHAHVVALFSIFSGTSVLFSVVTVLIYIPTNSIGRLPFLFVLTNTCYFLSFWWQPFWELLGDISL